MRSSSTAVTVTGAPGGGSVVVGRLASSGPLTPSLAGRTVNVRLRDPRGGQTWRQVTTTAGGAYTLVLPAASAPPGTSVRVFVAGGAGLAPIASPEMVIRAGGGGTTPGVVPGTPSSPGTVVPGG